MIQLQLINSVIWWERSLEFEEERRRNHRSEPYVNYLAAAQPWRKERKSIFARILQHRKERQPVRQAQEESLQPRPLRLAGRASAETHC